MRMLGLKFYEMYNLVFDSSVNPLKHIPDPASRFFIMVILATGWSGAFAFQIGSLYYFGWGMVAHLGVLFMTFFTASVFYDAERRGSHWLLMLKRSRQIPPVQDRRCKWDLEKEG
jgi:hypothetical protein